MAEQSTILHFQPQSSVYPTPMHSVKIHWCTNNSSVCRSCQNICQILANMLWNCVPFQCEEFKIIIEGSARHKLCFSWNFLFSLLIDSITGSASNWFPMGMFIYEFTCGHFLWCLRPAQESVADLNSHPKNVSMWDQNYETHLKISFSPNKTSLALRVRIGFEK